MSETASESELSALHRIVAESLKARIASGEASASDFSNAIKLLKDNNITCSLSEGNHLDELQSELDRKRGVTPRTELKIDRADLDTAIADLDFTQAQAG